MSGIEAVIARSRRPGGFSERKSFSVARRRGIQKLRRFALVDPHHYILELVQSAIANRANHLNIALEHERCTLSYIGGGLREAELGQLFDFLFASKDRTDIGHVRELALGLNAVLLFQPDRVVVESGDGTLAGTTRMVMHPDRDEVEVGRPERPLTGTYVHIEGMKRSRLPKGFRGWNDLETPRERGVIEENCLAAPIPILVDHEPLFGFSSQRTPGLFGYEKVLSIDEGDLYGTIGMNPSFGTPSFQLLTWGVAIQSKEHQLLPKRQIGGIVCFDALHKTVDHSGIVEDERLEELWIRLRPYAEQLVTGAPAVSAYRTTLLGGPVVPPADLRRLLREHPRVLVVPRTNDADEHRRATAIGRALRAPVLCASRRVIPSLRALSGGRARILTPDLGSDRSVAFYGDPPVEAPTRPWLAAPVEVEPLDVDELAHRICPPPEEGAVAGTNEVRRALGHVGEVEATVYTPEQGAYERDGLWVWVLTTQRLVWRAVVPSAFPGHVLVVQVPDADPFRLQRPVDRGPDAPALAAEVARVMAEHATTALATAFDRAFTSLGPRTVEPNTAAGTLGLAALARGVVPTLRSSNGEPAVGFLQLQAGHVDLLGLPLLRTRAGRVVCMRDVGRMMDACGGLLYGTVPSVPPAMDGLDPDRVLELDEASERLLISVLGEGPYVRIDRRDVLAEFRGVQCRDVALGLREHPELHLLVEGEDPGGWPDADRRACERALVVALIRRFHGIDPPPPGDGVARGDWEECRRQACRHLQWFVCRRAPLADAPRGRDAPDHGVSDLPLFLDAAGQPRTYREVRRALERPEGLTLLYGHAFGAAELGILAAAARRGFMPTPDGPLPLALVADPWIHRLLAPLGRVHLAFDIELSGDRVSGRVSDAFATVATVESPGCHGRVGVPSSATTTLDVPVIFPDNRQANPLTDLARENGVVGWVRLDEATPWTHDRWSSLATAVRAAAERALSELIDTLPTVVHPLERDRRLGLLLDYATRHIVIQIDPQGRAHANVIGSLVGRILSMPLFPSRFGGLLSGWRLVRRFCGLLQLVVDDPTREILTELRQPLPASLESWIRRTLDPGNAVRPPAKGALEAPPPPSPTHDGALAHPVLCATVEHWLARLRPDTVEKDTRVWLFQRDPEVFMEGVLGALHLNADHWLVAWAIRAVYTEPQALAWLLLAAYAHINAVLEPVANEHERLFQRRVLDALRRGELTAVSPAGCAGVAALDNAPG